MVKPFTFAILFTIACSISFAQNRKAIDSVRHELSVSAEDTNRVISLQNLAGYYWTYKTDSAYYYAQISLDLSRKIKFSRGEANALIELGLITSVSGNHTKSLELFLKALQLAEQKGVNGFEKAHAILNIGLYYGFAGNLEVSISYLQKSRAMFDAHHLSMMGRLTRAFLGIAYLRMNQLDSAAKYSQMAYDEMMRDKTEHYNVEATTNILNSLAAISAVKGDTKSALDYYRQSLTHSVENPLLSSTTYYGIAIAYRRLNEHDSAVFYAKRSLEEAQKGTYYQNMNDAGSFLSALYDSTDIKQAFAYNKIALAAKDSLIALTNRTAFKTLTEFDEKERQYEIDTATASYQNKVKFYALVAGLAVFLVIAFILYWNSRKQKEANAILQKQKQEIERQKKNVEATLDQLKATQAQLIQSEKMASLGELTAGIAHEIQNPLNFVNNFSDVNKELIAEMREEIGKGNYNEVTALAKDVEDNEEKINHHGKRADAIVKGMLQHSQASTGKKEATDIKALADEYLRLSYHGLRAKDNSFNATIKTDFDETIGNINIIPQDIGRVLLNLYNNAFYAVNEKKKQLGNAYEPILLVNTKKLNGNVEIRVGDNGNGIPQKVIDKIFQPFFTTKPTGQGTGLGLSLSYDIIKAHGGEIKVETKEREFTEFIIQLPIV